MTIEVLRKEIDDINHQIVQLLARRVEVARHISHLKKMESLPIDDQRREAEQYAAITRLAEKYQLNSQIVEKIFSLVIEYCKDEMREEI